MATTKLPAPMILRGFTIERVDEENRTVSGYCYRNAQVGDGFDLPRDVMERLTEDYLQWANVREMHGKSAVGTSEVTWDEHGAFMVCRVIDDAAWEKCLTGVYKGFSVGVKPTRVKRNGEVMRVLDGTWYETSLVDRPADPDSRFELARAKKKVDEEMVVEEEDAPAEEPAAEPKQPPVETTPEPEPAVETPAEPDPTQAPSVDEEPVPNPEAGFFRGAFLDKLNASAPYDAIQDGLSELQNLLWSLAWGEKRDANPGEAWDAALADFAVWCAPHIAELRSVVRAQGDRPMRPGDMLAEIERLKALPDPKQERPMMITAAGLVKRFVDADGGADDEAKKAEGRAEITRLLGTLGDGSSERERHDVAIEISRIKARCGIA